MVGSAEASAAAVTAISAAAEVRRRQKQRRIDGTARHVLACGSGEVTAALHHLSNHSKRYDTTIPTIQHFLFTSSVISIGDVPEGKSSELTSLLQDRPTILWNFSGRPLPSIVREAVHSSVAETEWRTPCGASQTPTLSCIVSTARAMAAWSALDETHLVVLYDPPSGPPRAAVVIAVLLRLLGVFQNSSHAYDSYCIKRQRSAPSVSALPPSYRRLFQNVDKLLSDKGQFSLIGQRSRRLRTISIGGLPLEEAPVVEIWGFPSTNSNSSLSSGDCGGIGKLLFASHSRWRPTAAVRWNGEYGDGLFIADACVTGDFVLTIRFGGHLATVDDKSTLIARYQHHTGLLDDWRVELPSTALDVNPTYAATVEADLAVHLLFDDPDDSATQNLDICIHDIPTTGVASMEGGLHELARVLVVRPDAGELSKLTSSTDISTNAQRWAPVALQLGNNDIERAKEILESIEQWIAIAVNNTSTPISQTLSPTIGTLMKDSLDKGKMVPTSSSTETKEPVCESLSTLPPNNPIIVDPIPASSTQVVSPSDSTSTSTHSNCGVCGKLTEEKSASITCKGACGKVFHRRCVGLSNIPFRGEGPRSDLSRQRYCETHTPNWHCAGCSHRLIEQREKQIIEEAPSLRSSRTSLPSDDYSRDIPSRETSVNGVHQKMLLASELLDAVEGSVAMDIAFSSPSERALPFTSLSSMSAAAASSSSWKKRRRSRFSWAVPDSSSSSCSVSHESVISEIMNVLVANNITVRSFSSMSPQEKRSVFSQCLDNISPLQERRLATLHHNIRVANNFNNSDSEVVGEMKELDYETSLKANESACNTSGELSLSSALKGLVTQKTNSSVSGNSWRSTTSAGVASGLAAHVTANTVMRSGVDNSDYVSDSSHSSKSKLGASPSASRLLTRHTPTGNHTPAGSKSGFTRSSSRENVYNGAFNTSTEGVDRGGGGIGSGEGGTGSGGGNTDSYPLNVSITPTTVSRKRMSARSPQYEAKDIRSDDDRFGQEMDSAQEELYSSREGSVFKSTQSLDSNHPIPTSQGLASTAISKDASAKKSGHLGASNSFHTSSERVGRSHGALSNIDNNGSRAAMIAKIRSRRLDTTPSAVHSAFSPLSSQPLPVLSIHSLLQDVSQRENSTILNPSVYTETNGGQASGHTTASAESSESFSLMGDAVSDVLRSSTDGLNPTYNSGKSFISPSIENFTLDSLASSSQFVPTSLYPLDPASSGSNEVDSVTRLPTIDIARRTPLEELPGISPYLRLLAVGGVSVSTIATKMSADGIVTSSDAAYEVLKADPSKPLPLGLCQTLSPAAVFGTKAFAPHSPPYGTTAEGSRVGHGMSSIHSGKQSNVQTNIIAAVPVAQHPRYQRFFAALAAGESIDTVKAAASAAGVDPSPLSLEPTALQPLSLADASIASHLREGDVSNDTSHHYSLANAQAYLSTARVPVSEHPVYAPYFSLLRHGISRDIVVQRMELEGHDSSLLSLTADTPVPLLPPPRDRLRLSEHPFYVDCFVALRSGFPRERIREEMESLGLDSRLLDEPLDSWLPVPTWEEIQEFEEKKSKLRTEERLRWHGKNPDSVQKEEPEETKTAEEDDSKVEDVDDGSDGIERVPAKDHPRYGKYFKMLRVGLPPNAVQQKMKTEGMNPAILDRGEDALIAVNVEDELADEEAARLKELGPLVRACEHPTYEKFFKMLRVGLPASAVIHKMAAEGVEGGPNGLLDNPDALIPLNGPLPPPYGGVEKKITADKGIKKRRLHWQALSEAQAQGATLWTDTSFEPPEIDEDELRQLFGDNGTAGQDKQRKKADSSSASNTAASRRPAFVFTDPKRGQNGSIALARIRFTVSELHAKIRRLDSTGLGAEQLDALETYLPTAEEVAGANQYADTLGLELPVSPSVTLQSLLSTSGSAGATVSSPTEGSVPEETPLADEDTLLQSVSTSDDIEKRAAAANLPLPNTLSLTERYMCEMRVFPSAATHLSLMRFRATLDSRLEDATNRVRMVQLACDDVRLSDRWRRLMKTLLRVGNAINSTTSAVTKKETPATPAPSKMMGPAAAIAAAMAARLAAKNEASSPAPAPDTTAPAERGDIGFTVASLLKLHSAKGRDRKTSVLQYAISVLLRQDPDCLEVVQDIRSVIPASRISIDELRTEQSVISEEIRSAVVKLEDIRTTDPLSDTDSMLDFLSRSNNTFESFVADVTRLKEKYSALLAYFGENPELSSMEFFSTLSRFITDFEAAKRAAETLHKAEVARRARERVSSANSNSKRSGRPSEKSPPTVATRLEFHEEVKEPSKDSSQQSIPNKDQFTDSVTVSNPLAAAVAAAAIAKNAKTKVPEHDSSPLPKEEIVESSKSVSPAQLQGAVPKPVSLSTTSDPRSSLLQDLMRRRIE